MKYIKYFKQDSDYQSYMNGGGGEVFLPNVSYVVNGNVVYFNPNLKIEGSKISGVFNVEDTSIPYVICVGYISAEGMEMGLKLEEIVSFKVDGVETEPIIETDPDMGIDFICCRFNNIGRHTIEMEFNVEDPTRIITFTMSTFVELDASQFDTSNITNMQSMFSGCRSLTSVGNLSNWDTSNVTNMDEMFNNCSSLTSLDSISNWDVSNVTNMDFMFSGCRSLTSVGNLSNWDTSNVTNMDEMFRGCTELTSLDLSNWDTINITNMSQMFEDCQSLTSLDLSNWDTSNVTWMNMMFEDCWSLTSLDLSNWDTSNVTWMPAMFKNCWSLTSLDSISNWDTSKVTDMDHMFMGCSGLTSLDLSNWDISNVEYMYGMFSGCTSLSEIKMGGNPSKVIKLVNYIDMFSGINTNGTFYYNSAYDYSKIIENLPSTWTAVPCTMVDGVLIPNE